MHDGLHVKKSEVHGMAQRGGSVESHVRFGKRIYSPLIEPKTADFLVCFHEDEGRRLNHYLKKDGINFMQFLADPRYRPSDLRFRNTFFLGMLSAFLRLKPQSWKNALAHTLKRNPAENQRAFDEGRKAGLRFSLHGNG